MFRSIAEVHVNASGQLVYSRPSGYVDDPDEWRNELPMITEWFEKFGDKLPGVLWAELDALKARLDAA